MRQDRATTTTIETTTSMKTVTTTIETTTMETVTTTIETTTNSASEEILLLLYLIQLIL